MGGKSLKRSWSIEEIVKALREIKKEVAKEPKRKKLSEVFQ